MKRDPMLRNVIQSTRRSLSVGDCHLRRYDVHILSR